MDKRMQRAIAAVELMMRASDVLKKRFEALSLEETPQSAMERLAQRLTMAFLQAERKREKVDELLRDLSCEERQWMRDRFPYQIFGRGERWQLEALNINDAVMVSEYIASLANTADPDCGASWP